MGEQEYISEHGRIHPDIQEPRSPAVFLVPHSRTRASSSPSEGLGSA